MEPIEIFGTAEQMSYQAMRKVEALKGAVNTLYDHYQIPELQQAVHLLSKAQEKLAALQDYSDNRTKKPAEEGE